jgi:NAD(P)-dependent dehydrogenase (short-subunit alcohol dehydrogenase family)
MSGFTIANQPLRFATAKEEGNQRMLNIDSVYDGSFLESKRVLVTGGNRGIGLAICKELNAKGAFVIATCRKTSPELSALSNTQIIEGCEVTSAECVNKSMQEITSPVDIVINNAGYFYEPLETIDSMNFEEELKMIDICAIGPLRVVTALRNLHLLKTDGSCKIAMITSQGGSISWREVQNPTGHDYGHHMSKAAANMGSKLLAQELKGEQIAVQILHPGFNKTGMTAKYEKIWEVEGAVDASVGAKRVLHEISLMDVESYNGLFINCEDGLQIPW